MRLPVDAAMMPDGELKRMVRENVVKYYCRTVGRLKRDVIPIPTLCRGLAPEFRGPGPPGKG